MNTNWKELLQSITSPKTVVSYQELVIIEELRKLQHCVHPVILSNCTNFIAPSFVYGAEAKHRSSGSSDMSETFNQMRITNMSEHYSSDNSPVMIPNPFDSSTANAPQQYRTDSSYGLRSHEGLIETAGNQTSMQPMSTANRPAHGLPAFEESFLRLNPQPITGLSSPPIYPSGAHSDVTPSIGLIDDYIIGSDTLDIPDPTVGQLLHSDSVDNQAFEAFAQPVSLHLNAMAGYGSGRTRRPSIKELEEEVEIQEEIKFKLMAKLNQLQHYIDYYKRKLKTHNQNRLNAHLYGNGSVGHTKGNS